MSQAERIEGQTLAQAVAHLERAGYKAQLGARPGAEVMCFACRATSPAREVELREMHRLEGPSDPAAEVVAAGVVCPRCGAKGTLVLTFGPAGSPEDAEVLRRLEDARPRPAHA